MVYKHIYEALGGILGALVGVEYIWSVVGRQRIFHDRNKDFESKDITSVPYYEGGDCFNYGGVFFYEVLKLLVEVFLAYKVV